MLKSTLPKLRCPTCQGRLDQPQPQMIVCPSCRVKFPILAGVAIVVEDVGGYLIQHVKGIASQVDDAEIPKEFRQDYLEAKAEWEEQEAEHIAEDLEAERVVALYLMNHFLRADGLDGEWWGTSPLIADLVRRHWDQGPMEQVAQWTNELASVRSNASVIELGCGVGGLARRVQGKVGSYLGVDSSFASIALARHAVLGAPYQGKIRIPADLIQGTVSTEVKLPKAPATGSEVDFIVGDIENPPLAPESWDITVALNAIDMMEEPAKLPETQAKLLQSGGTAIQSCPYIWHESIAKKLRAKAPKSIQTSHQMAEWLYERAGFQIDKRIEHLPWLFFKHMRQLEIYSVHLFAGIRK